MNVMRAVGLFAILTSALCSFGLSCQEKVDLFLKSPSESNYRQIAGSSSLNAEALCWTVVARSRGARDQITGLVARGNEWAIRFVANNLKRLDGGDLEDALVILGQASRRAPDVLLGLRLEAAITDRELGSAVTMLPEAFVDTKNESIAELKSRVWSFEGVSDSRLSSARTFVLNELRNAIKATQGSS